MRWAVLMWFAGADFWTLLVAALCMVVAFWFAEKHERKQRRIRESRRTIDYISALRRIHGRKP